MNPDILRWDGKYSAAEARDFIEADELLEANAALLSGKGRALDVACGAGANAIYAASRGYATVGVDGSIEGLRLAARRARALGLALQLINADLECYCPPPGTFDLVLVFRYLNRPLFEALKQTLRPGGVIFFKTFNRNLLDTRPGFNPDYLLEPGEIAGRFRGLEQIATNDDADNRAAFSWWIGKRPMT
jgi:SAM-dependent methyltransferase